MNLASWNIRFAPEFLDPPKVEDQFPWDNRAKGIAEFIETTGVHILATQEGNDLQLRDLNSKLANLELYDRHRTWTKRFFPSFFIDQAAFKVMSSGDLWLSQMPHQPDSKLKVSPWPRMLTWVCGEPRDSQERFLLVNVHMDADLPEQRKVFIELVKKLLEQVEHDHFLLFGDFNSPKFSESWKEITSQLKVVATHRGNNTPQTFNAHGAYLPRKTNWHIDWLLSDLRLEQSFYVVQKMPNPRPQGAAYYLSDHEPILLHLTRKQTDERLFF